MLLTSKETELIKRKMEDRLPEVWDEIKHGKLLDKSSYQALVDVTRDKRIAWWRKARFGIFIHYGIFSARGRGEWELAWDGIAPDEYEKSLCNLNYQKGAAYQWVKAAKEAGAGYVVLTTRHHDGFSLWNSEINLFNSVNYGPKIDIVQEFVDACRSLDMKIGFYSTLMDWRHPDGGKCAWDNEARSRFLEYTYQLNKELLTQYGEIDILWYDMPYPMEGAAGWNALEMNQRLRALQPNILINNRSGLSEDFCTPEENLAVSDKDWESCLTFNELSWGYIDSKQVMPYTKSVQEIAKTLAFCARNKGNLLLNIGPMSNGSVPPECAAVLKKIGNWLEQNGEAVYGERKKCCGLVGGDAYGLYGANMLSFVTAMENTVYAWQPIWPENGELTIAGYSKAPKRVFILSTGEDIAFHYENYRIKLTGLPAVSPDHVLGLTVIALKFEDEIPDYRFCGAYPHINEGNRKYNI